MSKFLLCIMFFISGLCGLLYQIVWLRLALAHFGIITPIVSIVISIFMFGLAIGSWLVGKYGVVLKKYLKVSSITLYGFLEIIIGIGAFATPILFSYGSNELLGFEGTSSLLYLLTSAIIIAMSILPWTIAMGATYPTVLEFLRESSRKPNRSFGMLYAANTAGAVVGIFLTVYVFIELFGFKTTLSLAAFCNFFIGLVSICWGLKKGFTYFVESHNPPIFESKKSIWFILFTTGLCSMAMEVIWIRCFTVILGTFVYSFALLLMFYLLSNWLGTFWYRYDVNRNKIKSIKELIALCAMTSCIPLLANNPQFLHWHLQRIGFYLNDFTLVILLSIVPFSMSLGYLTPLLIDNISDGNSKIAGKAYAINISGCILGPILAGYFFLPFIGANYALILFIFPLLILLITHLDRQYVSLMTCIIVLFFSFQAKSWEEGGLVYPPINYRVDQIHRDYTATTIAGTQEGVKFLKVNGQAMTSLSQDTKFMAHLPIAIHEAHPKSVLIICFGMGTSFRSATTWDTKVTVVELLPSVISSFNYYYADADAILANPNNHIVIDDGRRFLKRTKEKFDIVIVDPPPPLETSASSLLYSKEFFTEVKKHLASGGILMEWYGYPGSEAAPLHALARSIQQAFSYVRVYKALDEPFIGGYFFLCSEKPINKLTAQQFFNRLPEKAKKDGLEWLASNEMELKNQIRKILTNELSLNQFLVPNENIIITDDRPFNEYYFMRRYRQTLFLS